MPKFWGWKGGSSMRPTNSIGWVVVHHSAANDLYSTPDTLKAERRNRGEGYNFIIDDVGGKTVAVQDALDTTISNGVYGINTSSWNICIDGNFEHQHPSAGELHALVQVIATKVRGWGWRKTDVIKIIGHQYAGLYLSAKRYGTACPGRNLIALLPEIRRRVAVYLPA